MSGSSRLAGVELGGTKAIAVLAEGERIVDRLTIPTEEPGKTLDAINAKLRVWQDDAPFAGFGIATFGPVQLDPQAGDFACLLQTPKPGWSAIPVGASLSRGLACPMRIDTDVNAAALAELHHGAARGCASLCYVTIGTGVGGGLVIGGRPVHGALHPEIGHLCLRRAPNDSFSGNCIFHGDCIEGLVSGPALAARFAMPAADVPDDHPEWRNVAADLGELCAQIFLTTSANRIVFGGSVALSRRFLFPQIRERTIARLKGYLPFVSQDTAERIILPAALGEEAGPQGAIILAEMAAEAA